MLEAQQSKPKETTNVFFAGVGGQGIILASDLLAALAFRANYDVKQNEIHGLSQRGGAVTSHVRFGAKIYTPVIMEGEAHFLVAFEELEALRWAHMVRPDGRILASRQRILPASVTAGEAAYPRDVEATLAGYAPTSMVPAFQIAREVGEARLANTVLLGVLSAFLPQFSAKEWEAALTEKLKSKALKANQEAFARGREHILSGLMNHA